MLTLANVNTTQAKNYYKQENYYSQEEALSNSQWQGKGTSVVGLSGVITDLEAYDNIVNGLSPDGKTQLRQKQSHKDKSERAGIDLTFSAPKSVSIACLVGGDKRLEEAHRNAVSRTIDLIESRYATTRINKQPVQTDNLIVAKWHHDTSRELDPHLHTHCLIMNCTQGPDGKWRSISNKAFYQNKILLGQIYRNELALECRKLGYKIEPHPKELFEIKGYTREQIEGFSKRHEQIKNKLEEIGTELTTENKVWAWRKTRAKKNHEIGRSEKLPYWHEEADLYGIVTHPIDLSNQSTVQPIAKDEVASLIQSAVAVGIEHCSERQVAFRSEDIEKFITAEVKPFSIHELENAIAQHPELIKTFDGRYTTQSALARELATIKLMRQGKGHVNPITTHETVKSYLEGKTLTSGQKEAIALTATTCDQFIAWQGVAGAGKTFALYELKQITQLLKEVAEGQQITLLAGFAPSKEATKGLGEELGIETNTVASLLLSKQPQEPQPNQLWIIDEAGMLSAKDGYALLQRATAVGARVILVGDTRQLSAVEAGNPFKSLQQAGISTAHLNQSLRQKVPQLQLAAELAATGNHVDALQHLLDVGRVQEVPHLEERSTLIAQDYLQLSPEQRRTTLVLAGTHKEKAEIMQQVRAGLKQEGTLVGEDAVVTRLKQKDLTNVQARYRHHYNIGDVVIPLRKYKRAGLHKDRAYAICGYESDKLILSDWSGNQVAVDPMKFRKTVYTQQNIEVCVGDSLRWTREDKQSGRSNRDEFTVMAIEGRTATICYLNGREESLYLDQPLPLDYAIASTTYSSQGKTADRVLVSSTCDATVSSESVYVAISRAKYDLKIYAENVDFLLEQAQESKAQKTVLELLQPKAKVQAVAEKVATINSAPAVERSVNITAKQEITHEDSTPVTNIERPLKRQNQQAAKSTLSPTLKPYLPKQLEVFWHPISATETPRHIEAKHWQELVEGSAIHPDIAAANFRSLQMGSIEQEHQAWEYLMYSDKLERTNTGQLTTGMLKRYAHIDAGGWWCNSGANALSFSNLETGNEPQEKIWGCYKPNQPRSNPDKPGKLIKYEHPPKVDLGIFLLHVPDDIAQKIYTKADIEPTSEDRHRGFWYCVWKYNLPITITEGAKKSASLLSQGHAAIGLPGIYAGYRSKDEQGNPIKAHLHEELTVFATLGREISFCFDYETRPETKRNIEIAISRTGSLLQQQGAKVNVVSLPGAEKGVDDLIVARNPLAYEQAAMAALPLKQWRDRNKQGRHLAIVPPKKLSAQERKEKLKDSLLGQQPVNNQNLDQLPEQISHDRIEQWQINQESTADGRHNFADGDRQLDSQHRRSESSEHQPDAEHRGVESSEHRSFAGKQRTQELHPQAVERQPLDSQANARRLHHPVQVSPGATEVGQTERHDSRISGGDEQSVAQVGGHQSGSNPSQRAGDGGLRGDRQPAEATQEQWEEVATSNNGQRAQALGELAQVVQSVNDWQILGNAELGRKLAALTGQIDNLNLQRKPYEFSGLLELAQALNQQQSQSDAVESLKQIQPTLSKLTGQVVATDNLPQTTSSTLISDLQPRIQDLAQTVATWQLGAEFTKELAKTNQVIQQLKQRQTFDFGELPSLLSQVNYEQLLTQSGLDVELASLTQQLTQFTPPAPTVFAGMNAIAESLLAHQAQLQLPIAGLVEKANAIAQQITDIKPRSKVHEYKFEGSIALGELAQTLYCFTTEQQLQNSGLLEQLQQTTNKAISVISQHNEQLQEDLSMLQTTKKTKAFKQTTVGVTAYNQETATELTQQLRDLPLDEIAIRLRLTQDKHDKHKWRGEGQIISINDQKFYDHANLKRGYGAIDLVMHVQGRDFKEALRWLADSSLELPPVQIQLPQPKAQERPPFQLPASDESKWLVVRQHLTQKRQLPAALVDELHSQGKVYADAKQNAVFLRQDMKGSITGASLRGTYKDSSFKGLATGSQRENGWFSFTQGEGELKRIVLVESAIDAVSAAALAEQPGKAMFVSTDGAGSVPVSWLKQQQQQGVEIIAAHDGDRAGEEMAWRLAADLGPVTRATPTVGKDWNEQLKSEQQPGRIDDDPQPEVLSQWKLVAQAIGKSDAYLGRIEAVVASGQGLPIEAEAAMRQDFDNYKQTTSDLWQWHQSAKNISKSDAYLGRIAEVAIAFHHPKTPTHLSVEAIATMQQDLAQHEQLLNSSLWQHHSPITDLPRLMKTDSTVAHVAVKDGYSPQQEQLNTRALGLSVRLLSEFGKQQNRSRVSWTGGWYTFTKVGSNITINCSQRQSTILELSNGKLQGSITQRDVEKFKQVLEAIKTKEIVKQPEL